MYTPQTRNMTTVGNPQTGNMTTVISSKSQATRPKPDAPQGKEGPSRLPPSKALLPPHKPSVPSPKPHAVITRVPPKASTPALTLAVEGAAGEGAMVSTLYSNVVFSAASPVPADVPSGSQGTDGSSGQGEVTLATLGLKIGDQVVIDASSAKPKVKMCRGLHSWVGQGGTRMCVDVLGCCTRIYKGIKWCTVGPKGCGFTEVYLQRYTA